MYGDPLFCEALAEQLGKRLAAPRPDYLMVAPWTCVRRLVLMLSLEEARHLSRPFFGKPAESRAFESRIYLDGGELPAEGRLDGDGPVLISEIVRWEWEFRFFVREGQILTGSIYARDGKVAGMNETPLSRYTDASLFAADVVDETRDLLPPACVLDVGFIPLRGWAVVELNAVYASGLYGCHPGQALEAVAGAVLPGTDAEDSCPPAESSARRDSDEGHLKLP